MNAPSPSELAAYVRGDLDHSIFARVDAWLGTMDDDAQAAILAGIEADAGARHAEIPPAELQGFRTTGTLARYHVGAELGRGGMGLVFAAHDTLLDRQVAIKVLRPRAADESLDHFTLRQRLFRREAILLAGLTHPGIVTVHDIGAGPHGAPAYVMRRLYGAALTHRIDQAAAGAPTPPALAAEIVLRAAEAMAVAHEHGVVHRDLKGDNIWAGPHGEVVVIDWGLAGQVGVQDSSSVDQIGPATAAGVGTPAWMPPEQAQGHAAHPTMDVFALGAVLQALITGRTPHQAQDITHVPRGLVAVLRRCLDADPAKRYPHAGALAEDLSRWFAAGITLAEQASWPRRLLAWIARHRGASAIAFVLLASVAGLSAFSARKAAQERSTAQTEAQHLLATTGLDDEVGLRLAEAELDRLLRRYPRDTTIVQAQARIAAARSVLDAQARTDIDRSRLIALSQRYQREGPHVDEEADLLAGLQATGIDIDETATREILRHHPLRTQVLMTLTHLARLRILRQAPPAELHAVTDLLRSVGDVHWAAMGNLLDITETKAHDLVFCPCAFSEQVLNSRETADLLLAVYGPDARLVRYSESVSQTHPGSFWPHIVLSRAAISAGDGTAAREHALIAFGAESDSLWPNLALAYAALISNDDDELARACVRAQAANPSHAEVVLLSAVVAARSGRHDEAKALADQVGASHLQYHLQHPVGHPMEQAVHALIAAGIHIEAVSPDLGPLVPHHHH